jgi:transketolase
MPNPTLARTLEDRAATLRRHIVTMASGGQAIHLGGSLSIADLMAALFFHFLDLEGGERPRDHFILSKGHTVHAFHACLAELGKIDASEFSTLTRMGTRLAGHPSPKAPMVEVATGSLGHGLSVGIGIALAEQLDGLPSRTVVLMGDGELQEGSVWEAALCAPRFGLKNLLAIVDRNGLQANAAVDDILPLDPLEEKAHGGDRWSRHGSHPGGAGAIPVRRGAHGDDRGYRERKGCCGGGGATPGTLHDSRGRRGEGSPVGPGGSVMLGFACALAQGGVLAEMAEKDSDVVVVSQDLGHFRPFSDRFADRFFDLGVSEANLIGVAAGLARAGKRPFVLAMASFVSTRAFEQIRVDCGYNRNAVKIIAPCSGLEAGHWGPTHHAVEDLGLLRMVPGMTVLCPADPGEASRAVVAAAQVEGPVYVRLGYLLPIEGYTGEFEIGRAALMREGSDVAIMATGASVAEAITAHGLLQEQGISARVLNMHSIKPIDRETIARAAAEIGRIVTVEEHFVEGGLGGAVAEVLAGLGKGRLLRLGLNDEFIMDVAAYPDILKLAGLDAASIAAAATSMLD